MIINSSLGSYKVSFEDSSLFLKNNFKKADIVISDNYFKNFFPLKIKARTIFVKSNENSKSFENLPIILNNLNKLNISKTSIIYAFGGGVVQDISSFISSILFRGVDWFFLPSTLLAMGDSCIGGKTSINFQGFKNQIGNFYPPKKIIIDLSLINTLPKKEITSGIGEISHYFFVGDKTKFYILTNFLKTKKTDKDFKLLINNALSIKKSIIEIDEFDKKERLIFNFGHTFGHALESYFDYKILHGCAVTIGMMMSIYISYKLKFISSKNYQYMNDILRSIYYEKNLKINLINVNKYCEILKKDKKNQKNYLRPILTKGIGEMFIKPMLVNKKLKIYLIDFFKKY